MHALRGPDVGEEARRAMKRGAAVVLVLFAAETAAAQEASPADEARRAAVAKLGRLVWSDVGKPPAFCDLNGGNVVESDAPHVSSIRWLADGKRVVACEGGRVFAVDALSGKSTDLVADAGDDDAYWWPRPAETGARAVAWHKHRRRLAAAVGYTVFDLAQDKRFEIAPPVKEMLLRPDLPVWFAPDGTILAVLGTAPETLVRFDAGGKRLAEVAVVPDAAKIRVGKFVKDRLVYAVERQDAVEVRDSTGATLGRIGGDLEPTLFGVDEAGLLRLEVMERRTRRQRAWYFAAGRPPRELTKAELWRQFWSDDRRWSLSTRYEAKAAGHCVIVRTDASTGLNTDICPGDTLRRVGNVFVFWRVRTPAPADTGGASELEGTIESKDLWCYDPKDGAVFRMTDRGFTARCWDLYVTPPPAPRAR
jgi:hypothetical protein